MRKVKLLQLKLKTKKHNLLLNLVFERAVIAALFLLDFQSSKDDNVLLFAGLPTGTVPGFRVNCY